MSDERTGAATDRVANHEELLLSRRPDAGFVLTSANTAPILLRPAGAGWDVGADRAVSWSLESLSDGGFVLREADGGREVGRSAPLVGAERDASLRHVLLDDGRLFRIRLRGPRDPRFELLGWETPGAYLEGRPEADGWRIKPTTASCGIEDIRALSFLLAAEMIDAEGDLNNEIRR